jgi:hypothetical protein
MPKIVFPRWTEATVSFAAIANVFPTHSGPTEFEAFAARVAAGADHVNAFALQAGLQAGGALLSCAIGLGIEAAITARAAGAAQGAADLTNLEGKIIKDKDMVKRGWTKQGIMDTIQQAEEGGTTFTVPNNYTGGTATEYVNPSTGKFVVVDDATKKVIQESGRDFQPNYLTK